MASGPVRTIKFRGKCALSTGMAIGAVFPTVGGWIFEIPQPPAVNHWRSDASPTPGFVLREEIIESNPAGTDIVLALNIRGDGRDGVIKYIELTGVAPSAFVFMAPQIQGAQSIGGAEDACAMARAIRNWLGEVSESRNLRLERFILVLLPFRFFLGSNLPQWGK